MGPRKPYLGDEFWHSEGTTGFLLGPLHDTRRHPTMTTEDFIITLFCEVDDRMGDMGKHPQARLWPSELVTIGLLFALKGGYFRAFCRWLSRDNDELFGGLPHRTRLLRQLATHANWVSDSWLIRPSSQCWIAMALN